MLKDEANRRLDYEGWLHFDWGNAGQPACGLVDLPVTDDVERVTCPACSTMAESERDRLAAIAVRDQLRQSMTRVDGGAHFTLGGK